MGSEAARHLLRKQRYDAGLCVQCGEPRHSTARMCRYCTTKNSEAHRRYVRTKRHTALQEARRKQPRALNYATDDLILQWMPLVYRYAHRVKHRAPACVDFDDLVGAGMLGLVEAGRVYQFDRCVPFSAWIRRYIKGRMFTEIGRHFIGRSGALKVTDALAVVDERRVQWRA